MAETQDDAPLVRRQRCSDCAFTPGTGASACSTTAVKREICAATGAYFYCHRDAFDTHYIEEPEALCAGWYQAVKEKLASGEIEAMPAENRTAALSLLDRINEIERGVAG